MGARLTNVMEFGRFEVRSFGNGWAYEVHEFNDEGETVATFWVQDADADTLEGNVEGWRMSKEGIESVLETYMEVMGD